MTKELSRLGARVSEKDDGLVIEGVKRLKGSNCFSHGDHRVAMALIIAGLVAEGETSIEDTGCIETSFPGFMETIKKVI